MKAKRNTTEAAGTPAPSSDPTVMVEITEAGNGVLINGCHHAKGKVMQILQSQFDALIKNSPADAPPVKFAGV